VLATKATDARKQADLYRAGVLGGAEVKGTRYVVLVTGEDLPAPGDVSSGTVVYRHVVIAVAPRTPSAAARRRK
jgi:hypothetical protein